MSDATAWYSDKALFGSLVACAFALVTVAVSIFHIRHHLTHYNEPKAQRYTIRILLMVPVYAVNSAISLFTYKTIGSFIVTTLRDCYEAYTLYNFFALCLCYCGGPNLLVTRWQSDDARLPVSWWTMTCCLSELKLDGAFLRMVRQGTLQFVIMKLVLAAVALGLRIAGVYDEGHFRPDRGYVYVTVIYNTSIFLALYSLVLFYLSARVYLAPFKPLAKFALVKTIIFVTFWQNVLIAILFLVGVAKPLDGLDATASVVFIQNFLLCVESLPIALLNIVGFPAPVRDGKISNVCHSLKHFVQMNDVLLDTATTFDPTYKEFLFVNQDDSPVGDPSASPLPSTSKPPEIQITLMNESQLRSDDNANAK